MLGPRGNARNTSGFPERVECDIRIAFGEGVSRRVTCARTQRIRVSALEGVIVSYEVAGVAEHRYGGTRGIMVAVNRNRTAGSTIWMIGYGVGRHSWRGRTGEQQQRAQERQPLRHRSAHDEYLLPSPH